MNKLGGFFLFFSLVAAFHVNAQDVPVRDTAIVKDTASIVKDTTQAQNAHELNVLEKKYELQKEAQALADSEKMAEAKTDSGKVAHEKVVLGSYIASLASNEMYGRGYVNNGRDIAARYILKKFKDFKLQPIVKNGPFAQGYAFPVNTFPGQMDLSINDAYLAPGNDYLIDASSSSFTKKDLKFKKIDLNKVPEIAAWRLMKKEMDTNYVYLLENVDSFCANMLHIRTGKFAAELPRGCFIIPAEGRLMWTVSRETVPATIFYVRADAIPKKIKKVSVSVTAAYMPHAHNENIVACVPGDVKDTFIAFTAHYDHLGMMGQNTIFPGASDNASGTATLLYLASYFSKHPQHYSILFIAFSGEEAALMGSEFFVDHPMVPLQNIKFLTNIDIMGDATDGITVVNATEFPKQFLLLQEINQKHSYLPVINSRGTAANSDHYYFTQAGVPSFFIYSAGGKGYYHDVYDRARAVTLNHIDDVTKLLIDFVQELNEQGK